jgi:ligand-binding SRPBCC domain-containing protein
MKKGVQRMIHQHRLLEKNGGQVLEGPVTRFLLAAGITGYADAQIDDFGQSGKFHNRPGTTLNVQARFSHTADSLLGTAGFGFWNAPYGDPSFKRIALPQAVWFFFASRPADLPFAPGSPGRGWFAGTIAASTGRGLIAVASAPMMLVLNQFSVLRRRLWPAFRHQLGIASVPLYLDMRLWHEYRIDWQKDHCRFEVDGQTVLLAEQSPRGPLGFVCWLDNQYLVLSPQGRFRTGTLALPEEQFMEVMGFRQETG